MAKPQGKSTDIDPGDFASQYLTLVEDPALTDPETITRKIVGQILATDDLDTLLGMGDQSARSRADIVGRPFVITERPSWHKARDAYADGVGVFVVITGRLTDKDEPLVVTSGGNNVLAQLYVMQTNGHIPSDSLRLKFTQRDTAAGNVVLWLARADEAF